MSKHYERLFLYDEAQKAHKLPIKRRPTPLAADAASRPCIAARFGYVRRFELKRASEKSRRG
jgi:hypothetical protein